MSLCVRNSHSGSILLLLLLAALLLAGCAQQSGKEGKHILVTTSEPIKALAQQVAGDSWEVIALMDAGTNPESFDPTVAALAKAAEAEVIAFNGVAPADKELAQRISSTQTRMTDVAEGLTLLYGTHGDKSTPDPHIWTSPLNAAKMAANIARALAAADKTNATLYRQRSDSLTALYGRIAEEISRRVDSIHAKCFVTDHPSLSYFADHTGLTQLSLGEEHKEQSTKGMVERIERVKASGAKILFLESQPDSARLSTLAQSMGLRIVVLPTNCADLQGLWKRAITSLSE